MGSISKTIDFDNPTAIPPVTPVKFAHVVLQTTDMPRLRDWYLKFLNARVQHNTEIMSFLTYDEEHHRVAMIQLPDLADRDRKACGVNHVAYTLGSVGELMLAYRQRLEHGIKPVWCVNHGPTFSMYYRDPDGNQIEFQVDSFATAEEENAYMLGDAFKENPIGVDFDPEDIIKRLKGGESEESILVRPGGPRQNPLPH